MPPLHAAPTAATLADVHVKAAHMRLHDGQLFLELVRDAHFVEGTAARGTASGQWHVDHFVHECRRVAMSVAAVVPTWPTTRHLRVWRRRAFRERCRLSLPGAASRVQLFFQSFIFTFQALAGALRFLELPTQTIDFTIQVRQ
jgi:hypothetical protein